MSVVVVDLCGDLGDTLRSLCAEGSSDLVEVVLVTPDPDGARIRYPELEQFAAVQVLRTSDPPTTGAARATGFRAASAPVVTYCEEHAFPEPGWVAARLAAHDAGAAAVGAGLRNVNTDTAVSWAHCIQCFGPFVVPVAGGRSSNLPWHQTSYRRELLPDGPELESLLECEGLLHDELHRAGHTLVFEPAAVAGHLSPSRLRSLFAAAWYGGRVWGAGRAKHGAWSPRHRLTHAALFPHTAFRELRLRLIDSHRVIPSRWRSVALLLGPAIVVHAVAEAVGVLFGAGDTLGKFNDIELNRRAYLTADEAGITIQP